LKGELEQGWSLRANLATILVEIVPLGAHDCIEKLGKKLSKSCVNFN
jgi:hypothetical protein